MIAARTLLEQGRTDEIGPLLTASHASLRDDFRVTVPQLDVAAKAALDAESLADALLDSRDIDAALARYHTRQHLFGTRVVARARHVGAHLGAQATKPPETWTPEERHQDPVRMMKESGARLRDVPQLIELVLANRADHADGTDRGPLGQTVAAAG